MYLLQYIVVNEISAYSAHYPTVPLVAIRQRWY